MTRSAFECSSRRPTAAAMSRALCPDRPWSDPADVERKIGPRTKAIIPIDQIGLPCEIDAVQGIAARHGISPRYVRKLFEEDGSSFSAFVLCERVAKAHRMLIDRRYAHLNIAQIANAVSVRAGELPFERFDVVAFARIPLKRYETPRKLFRDGTITPIVGCASRDRSSLYIGSHLAPRLGAAGLDVAQSAGKGGFKAGDAQKFQRGRVEFAALDEREKFRRRS